MIDGDVLISGDHVTRPKPAPDAIVLAAGKLCVDPGELAYVGDSSLDLRAATAAGSRSVAAAWGTHVRPGGTGRCCVVRGRWKHSVSCPQAALCHDASSASMRLDRDGAHACAAVSRRPRVNASEGSARSFSEGCPSTSCRRFRWAWPGTCGGRLSGRASPAGRPTAAR
ncbi:HAD family hydrolase [Streptomyces sp. NPDC057287]|uniref:HAD family hydrolase n=1 Tax=Streptomyces sp. NPDC057287 TaxID=3346086 RepID=UPI00364417E7